MKVLGANFEKIVDGTCCGARSLEMEGWIPHLFSVEPGLLQGTYKI